MTPGEIQYRERAQQLIDFRNMRWNNNITPTDIDGFVDFYGRHFVFIEYKLVGKDLPFGQRLAYEHVAQAVFAANRDVVVFVCEHDTSIGDDILAHKATVREMYHKNMWQLTTAGWNIKDAIDSFHDYCVKNWENNQNQPF